MKHPPVVPTKTSAKAPTCSPKLPESQIHNDDVQRVGAVTARVRVKSQALAIVKALAALIFFDLLRAHGISRPRRASYGLRAE